MEGCDLSNILKTTEEQNVFMRLTFHNEDTMSKETEPQYAIGKKIHKFVKP